MLLASCKGGGESSGNCSPLLCALPSDALEVAVCEHCSDLIEVALGSDDALRSIDYGRMSSSAAALAQCGVGTVKPLLVIDAGPVSASDTSSSMRDILSQAESLGIRSALRPAGRRRALVLTPSESIMGSVERHIESGTSVLDAPGFERVLPVLCASDDAMVFRNRAASKLIPKAFLYDCVEPAALRSFLSGFAEWTVIPLSKGGSINPVACCDDSPMWYSNIFSTLPEGPSRLQMPDTLDFAVSVCTPDIKAFRSARESFIDAHSKLQKYKNTLASLKSSGYGPLQWELESEVKEIAKVFWEGRNVTLVRVCKGAKAPGPGFLSVLYGDLFEPGDLDSSLLGDWLVLGTRENVDAYLSKELVNTPLRQAHYAVYLSKTIISD